MTRKLNILLIEDSPAFRETIALATRKEADMELIRQYGTAEEALRAQQDMSTRAAPDVTLLDLNLPGMSGIEAIPYLKHSLPDVPIMVLTQSNQEADVLAAISAGAAGYLLKGATRRQLFGGIRNVARGGALLDPKVATFILDMMRAGATTFTPRQPLSERETQVLALLAEGFVQKEIASQLEISVNTVATHIRRVYEKLRVQNAPAAVTQAYKAGILPSQ